MKLEYYLEKDRDVLGIMIPTYKRIYEIIANESIESIKQS